jgi:hypothetical protein
MAVKRLTKEELQKSTGILNPVGHVVIAFADDAVTAQAAEALRELGFTEADILIYPASEATPLLRERVRVASVGAGHGFEITLMRRYLRYAEKGAGWLVVYAATDTSARLVADVAERLRALCAVRYHPLANEDLIF